MCRLLHYCFIFLLIPIGTVSFGQVSTLELLLDQVESLLVDSAQYEDSERLSRGLLGQFNATLNSEQKNPIYYNLGLISSSKSDHAKDDSFYRIALTKAGQMKSANSSKLIRTYNKLSHTAGLRAHREDEKYFMETGLNLANERGDTLDASFVQLLIHQFIQQNNSFQLSKSKKTIERAFALANQMKPIDSALLFDVWSNKIITQVPYVMGAEVIDEVNKILPYCRRNPVKTKHILQRTLYIKANTKLLQYHDVNRTLNTLNERLQSAQKHFPPYHPIMAQTLTQFATAYCTIGDIDQTRKFVEQANFILLKHPGRNRTKYNNYNFIATSYMQSGDIEFAKEYYRKAYQMCIEDPALKSLLAISRLLNMSSCFLELNQVDSAKIILDFANQ